MKTTKTTTPGPQTLSERLIASIITRFRNGLRIRRNLPDDGRIRIDRRLPFLCVYRQPDDRPDPGTRRLTRGEASYLVASGKPDQFDGLSRLVLSLAECASEAFGAFLIIEIWSATDTAAANELEQLVPSPRFRIHTSLFRPPASTIDALKSALEKIRVHRRRATVDVVRERRRAPPGMRSLIGRSDSSRLNVFTIGLEIDPIYFNPESGDVYPLVLRLLHRRLAHALKRAFFEFSRSHTNYRPPSHRALGHRACTAAVWEIDRRLAEIGSAYDFLLQVTPVNATDAWQEFEAGGFERPPRFYYRPTPVDPAHLKGALYDINLDRIEDPTLAYLFRQKRTELDRQLSLLSIRNQPEFLYGSLQLYGTVDTGLLELAQRILAMADERRSNGGDILDAQQIAALAQAEIELLRQRHPGLAATVSVQEDISSLMVSQGNLLVGSEVRLVRHRAQALIQHEIGTHVLTYYNGRAQPLKQLYTGLAGYDELQEGLAVLAEYLCGGLTHARMRLLAARVVAVHCLIEGATFTETFQELSGRWNLRHRIAFGVTTRVYRGGGLTKDAIYLRGVVNLVEHLVNGGKLEPLFVGKIGLDHLPLLAELTERKVLAPIPLLPRYLDSEESQKRLARLKRCTAPSSFFLEEIA